MIAEAGLLSCTQKHGFTGENTVSGGSMNGSPEVAESPTTRADYTCTPDRRYFVVRGRLWRLSNPALDEKTHQELVNELMAAKRAVQDGKDSIQRIAARLKVDAAKRALGGRGPGWGE